MPESEDFDGVLINKVVVEVVARSRHEDSANTRELGMSGQRARAWEAENETERPRQFAAKGSIGTFPILVPPLTRLTDLRLGRPKDDQPQDSGPQIFEKLPAVYDLASS